MLVGYQAPFLTITPDDSAEAANLQTRPWIFPLGQGFGAYWTYLDAMRTLFPGIRWDPSVSNLGNAMAIRSDLTHLPAWDRSKVDRFFFDEYKPRPYQSDGIFFLLSAKRAIVADATGLGKTIQSAGACGLHAVANPNDTRPVLVVCPSGLRYQWRREVMRMLKHPGTGEAMYGAGDFAIVDGAPAIRKKLYTRKPPSWVVVSYELVLRDWEAITAWLKEAGGVRAMIVDESSRVKNVTTSTFERVAGMAAQFDPALLYLLNATPIENGLEDLWAQFRIVCPWIFPSLPAFRADYISTVAFWFCRKCGKYRPKADQTHYQGCQGRGGYGWKPDFERVVGYRNLPEVKALIRDRYVRRDYTDVDEQLPEMVVTTCVVDLGTEQRRAYDAVKQDPALDSRVKIGELTRRALFAFDTPEKVTKSAKLDALPDILKEIGDQKAVLVCESKVFTLFASAAMAAAGWKVGVITGETGGEQREDTVRRFSHGETQLLFGTSAIERGLNLQAAGWIINLDIPWNPAKWLQRVGRIRRIGARHASVRVINLVARSTVEDLVLEAVYQKLGVFNSIFEGDVTEETFAGKIDVAALVR